MNIKYFLGTIIAFLGCGLIYSQTYTTEYDKQMRKLATDLLNRVEDKNNLKIAVWYFKDSFREKTVLGDYFGQEIYTYLFDANNNIEVMDRDAIDQVLDEHRLNKDEDFYDPRTVKELGMYIQADAVVTGTVDVANSHSLKIRIKLVDIKTGKTLATIPRNIPKNENIKYILHESGINKTKNIDKDKNRLNRGERYSNPQYVDVKCEQQKIGDYCIENDTNKNYRIKLTQNQSGNQKLFKIITIRAGQSSCFTDMPEKTYNFEMEEYFEGAWPTMRIPKNYGSFKVESCKSIVYTISSTFR